MRKDVVRLFSQFQPDHYTLELQPEREAKTFHGSVVITGRKRGKPSRRLTFHQHGLKITSAHIVHHDKKGDREIEVDRINVHNRYDEVRLHATTQVYPGQYTITLHFSGPITKQMNGIYPCFFEHDNKPKQLIATQFESHHAREVFPCIDEPEAKATFDLTLITPVGETVIANTPALESTVISVEHPSPGQRQKTSFETTPRMSTYLLAFVFGEMGYQEATTKDGVLVRTYATPDNVQHTKFALETAVRCLEFYNDYFAIPYPLAKCDLVALPDFASGAMENWGCITFREHTMLVDKDNSTLANQQYVAMVVAHELTHQWFGNLVTMRWWTDLWLNEGFASWMEYLAVDHLFPDWQMWTQFIVDEQQLALKRDALQNTHPIEVEVHHPDEIRAIFDVISYNKGASVIHMLHEYLGPAMFCDGLRHYLKQHSYGNTDTVDLWSALEEVAHKPVKQFMHEWTSRPGFPLVEVKQHDDTLTLKQRRYFANPAHQHRTAEPWPVPLLVEQNDLPEMLTKHETDFKLGNLGVIKLNSAQSGFYRVHYDAAHLDAMAQLVREQKLAPLDRLGVLSDAVEVAKAGYGSIVEALDFMENFREETNYAVWDVMATTVGSVRYTMDDSEIRKLMKPYVQRLVQPELKRLGWERQKTDSHFDNLLRPIILGLAAGADQPEVVAHCQKLFNALPTPTKSSKDPLASIHPDVRGVVFATVARLGDEATFNKLLALHQASRLSEEQNSLAAALTSFRQADLIRRALSLIKTDTVRLQDAGFWIVYSFLNRHAKHITWEWFTENWSWMKENMGNDLGFYNMPNYVARAFSDASFIPEFSKFFEPKLEPALKRSYLQGVETLEWQSAWRTRDLEAVRAYFTAHQ